MKKLIPLLALLALLTACASNKPPTATEKAFFDITTNLVLKIVNVTNMVPVYQTNTVVETRTITNQIGLPVPIFVTNITSFVTFATNIVTQTNLAPSYTMVPGKNAQTVAEVGGAVGNLFGVGGLASTIILGLFSAWAGIRNRQYAGQNDALTQTAGVLAQNIQTLRQVIQTTPQGAQLGALIKQYLITHQAQAGVVEQVSGIVKNVVDNESAKAAADEMLKLLQLTKAG